MINFLFLSAVMRVRHQIMWLRGILDQKQLWKMGKLQVSIYLSPVLNDVQKLKPIDNMLQLICKQLPTAKLTFFRCDHTVQYRTSFVIVPLSINRKRFRF